MEPKIDPKRFETLRKLGTGPLFKTSNLSHGTRALFLESPENISGPKSYS